MDTYYSQKTCFVKFAFLIEDILCLTYRLLDVLALPNKACLSSVTMSKIVMHIQHGSKTFHKIRTFKHA